MNDQPVLLAAAENPIRRLRYATAIAYVVAFLLITLTVMYGLNSLRNAHAYLERVMARQDEKVKIVTETQIAFFRRAETIQLLMLTDDPHEQDAVYMDYLKYGLHVDDGRNRTRALLLSELERAVMARQDGIVEKTVSLHEQIADLARNADYDAARQIFVDQVADLHEQGHITFQALRDLYTAEAKQAVAQANRAYQDTFDRTIAVMLLSLIVAIGIGVLTYRASARITSRLRDNVGSLRHLALHDSLTGLLNRAAFSELIEQRLNEGASFAVLYMDLDGFKQVNDEHGHGMGDQLLMMAAARIRSRMRGIDTVARFGGDEFVAMMTGINQPDECEHAARHIIEAFSQPFTHDEVTARIGVSVGVAVAPLHGRDASQLLDMADRAMYEAKNQGRNRYKMYQPRIELAVNNGPVV